MKLERNADKFGREFFRERPPGLIQHVLTVLLFFFPLMLLLRSPPSSRSLRLRPPQLPHHPYKNGTHSTSFAAKGGHTPNFWWGPETLEKQGRKITEKNCHQDSLRISPAIFQNFTRPKSKILPKIRSAEPQAQDSTNKHAPSTCLPF